jgi:type I restriction-modification system DNA methylase subunit
MPMTTIRKNERSWAIELISQINQFSKENDLIIKHAGGESTVSEHRGQNMFPDVILYGDHDLSSILQGWELKMPDVPINDEDFVYDAQRKARALGLNSCVIWNFTYAKLFIYNDENKEFQEKRKWQNLDIKTRNDVQLYKVNWEKTLRSVLTSVNEYLVSGDLKKSFIGEVLTKTSIATLVNEHKAGVANVLQKAANENSVMSAYIDNWWKEIKTEYKGDEIDKYSAYAKSVIINWSNRIIFAHLIKRRQQSAFAIDSLNYTSTPSDGNQIFREITEKSDFFNIFGPVEYNECLPIQTWIALIELSLILKDSPIDSINQRILQQVLEGSVNESKRLVNGQYPTPPILAEILSRITIHNPLGNSYDGCCGTGTIPSFIINFKKERMGASRAMATTWASDKFKLPLQIANLAMTSYDTINMPCRLFQRDILSLHPGDKVEIVNPQTGEKETYILPLFDSIVSNLPFVKASEISTDDTEFVQLLKSQYQLSGRSDFSYYVALHLHNLVNEGGYVGIILSNSFLGTDAGDAFFDAIRDLFDNIQLHISGRGRWFSNAEIVTALLVMRKKVDNESNSNISFFRWNRSLNIIKESNDFIDCIVNSSLLDREIDSSIVSRANYSEEELRKLKQLNISYNALFANLKWLVDIKDSLIPLNRILDVIRGSRRGCDAMFYPRNDSNIEPQFLHDVMKNLKRTQHYVASPDRKAFCCSKTMEELESNNLSGALSWIKKFEDVVDDYGLLPKRLKMPNMEWYELQPNEVAEMGTMMNPDDRMFYVKFPSPTFINQRVIGFNRRCLDDDLDLLHALLNSIISIFYIEAVGFGRGLGALDISKKSISKCYMLNPALLSDNQVADIKDKFSLLVDRGIVDIEQDIADPIRREFDMAVLNAYGIENYYETIIESFKSMRRMRKTVKQSPAIQIHLPETDRYESHYEAYLDMAAESDIEN